MNKSAMALRAIIGHHNGLESYVATKYSKEYNAWTSARDTLASVFDELYNSSAGSIDDLMKDRRISGLIKNEKDAREKLDTLTESTKAEWEERKKKCKGVTKTCLISGTPISYLGNSYLAEGIAFDYGEGGFKKFAQDVLGFEKQRRQVISKGELKTIDELVPPETDLLEYAQKLHRVIMGNASMTNELLKIDADFNSSFIMVKSKLFEGVEKILDSYRSNGYSEDFVDFLNDKFNKQQDYNRMVEYLKAKSAIPMINQYLKMGKKVAVFHDTTKVGAYNVFRATEEELKQINRNELLKNDYKKYLKEFKDTLDLIDNELGIKEGSKAEVNVGDLIANAFKDNNVQINGENNTQDDAKIAKFNSEVDGKKVDVLIGTIKKCAEGISIHDKTGNFPRVLIRLDVPMYPVKDIQAFNRVYRFGSKSNSMIRYLTTGLYNERNAIQGEGRMGDKIDVVQAILHGYDYSPLGNYRKALMYATSVSGNPTKAETYTLDKGGKAVIENDFDMEQFLVDDRFERTEGAFAKYGKESPQANIKYKASSKQEFETMTAYAASR
ncbi:MAG: hypothetical protein Q4A15_12865, partial [Prevotellaceae bacterium]|nr:hypothetical protein [Prevotellaceae bacterium]